MTSIKVDKISVTTTDQPPFKDYSYTYSNVVTAASFFVVKVSASQPLIFLDGL